jgi:hypothetical protein
MNAGGGGAGRWRKSSTPHSDLPDSTSQRRTVLSSLAEAMKLASGENTAERTQLACPLKLRTKRREGIAHIFTVLSSEAVNRC